jgi:hypothetical protein
MNKTEKEVFELLKENGYVEPKRKDPNFSEDNHHMQGSNDGSTILIDFRRLSVLLIRSDSCERNKLEKILKGYNVEQTISGHFIGNFVKSEDNIKDKVIELIEIDRKLS